MLNFTYNVPTKVFFGKQSIDHLGGELTRYGTRILLVHGQGSIKTTRVYDTVMNILKKNHVAVYELSGVQPNPRVTLVQEGIVLCREHAIECILAVGGGSVIDTSKAIATGVYHDKDAWDMFRVGDSSVKHALPLGAILTIAGTGSEMNGNAVISNETTGEKLAIHHDLLRPRFSILDPTFTFSVSKALTAAGTVDIFSHILEQYFSPTKEAFVQDRLAEGLLQTCITYGPIALAEPANYEARAQLMWTSSVALNGLLGYGRVSDWATHGIEHAVSAVSDMTHGVGLAILTPSWMEYILDDETEWKCAEYARNVWRLQGSNERIVAMKGIEKTRKFFKKLGMPTALRTMGIKEKDLETIAAKTVFRGAVGKLRKLDENDVLSILKIAF